MTWKLVICKDSPNYLVLFYKIISGLTLAETEGYLTPADSHTRKNHSFKFKHLRANCDSYIYQILDMIAIFQICVLYQKTNLLISQFRLCFRGMTVFKISSDMMLILKMLYCCCMNLCVPSWGSGQELRLTLPPEKSNIFFSMQGFFSLLIKDLYVGGLFWACPILRKFLPAPMYEL